jgi:hypothetical protein
VDTVEAAVTRDQLPVGTLVSGEVVGHQRWGVDVRMTTPLPGVMGVIDLVWVSDEAPSELFADYPPIGSTVEAVVVAHAPNGQIRLSTRRSDLRRASGA